MKLQDFQSSKCSYPAHVPHAITWSEDDCIAMATAKGVYITELRPSRDSLSPTLATKRYFIPCNTFLPTQDCGINLEDLTKILDQKGIYDLIQDIIISPVLLKKKPLVPAVKYVAWSPVFSKHDLRCLIGVLTDAGSLDIYSLWRSSCKPAAAISKLWHSHCSQGWDNPTKDTETLMELKNRAYKIKFSAFTWSTSTNELFAGSCDGTVSIWTVVQDPKTRIVQAKLVKEFRTERVIITALHYQYISPNKCVLIICYIDGRVACIVLMREEENISVSKFNILWDEADKIQVYSGGLISQPCYDSVSQLTTLLLQVVKGCYIIIIYLNLEGSLKSYDIVSVEELSVTGLASLSCRESLITGYSGTIYLLTLNDGVPSLSKLQDSLRTMHYSCNGLALSRSKCLAVLPFSVKTNYDHLAMKDLCNMLWCSIYDIPTATKIFMDSSSLSQVWDILEIIRIESLMKNSTIAWSVTSEDLDTMDSQTLKKNLALLRLSILLEKTRKDSSIEDKVIIEKEIQDLVMSCHVFKRLSHFMGESILSELERYSLFLLEKWIDFILSKYPSKYKQTMTVAATLRDQLTHDQESFNQELCAICGDQVENMKDGYIAECRGGHSVPRCSISLVQCTDVPYYSCYKCNQIAHTNAVSDGNYQCIFCDYTLRLSEMVLEGDERGMTGGSEIS